MERRIDALGPGCYTHHFGQATEGIRATTLIAQVQWPNEPGRRAYVKCFPLGMGLVLLNEITGYLLAAACNLPLPQRAAVLLLPDVLLAQMPRTFPLAFAVSEVSGHSPKALCDLNDPVAAKPVLDKLERWPRLAEAIAFDDWTANQDRNGGNLVIRGEGDVVLIDHSDLPVRPIWSATDLQPERTDFTNHLGDEFGFGAQTPIARKHKIALAAQEHADALQGAVEELSFWWDALLSEDAERRAALEHFIAVRADAGFQRLSERLRLLPLE